jgi:hypothetical protein
MGDCQLAITIYEILYVGVHYLSIGRIVYIMEQPEFQPYATYFRKTYLLNKVTQNKNGWNPPTIKNMWIFSDSPSNSEGYIHKYTFMIPPFCGYSTGIYNYIMEQKCTNKYSQSYKHIETNVFNRPLLLLTFDYESYYKELCTCPETSPIVNVVKNGLLPSILASIEKFQHPLPSMFLSKIRPVFKRVRKPMDKVIVSNIRHVDKPVDKPVDKSVDKPVDKAIEPNDIHYDMSSETDSLLINRRTNT